MYQEKIEVVAICDNEAFVYALPDAHGVRERIGYRKFNNRGQALQFAIHHEEGQRKKKVVEDEVAKQSRRRSFKQPERSNA